MPFKTVTALAFLFVFLFATGMPGAAWGAPASPHPGFGMTLYYPLNGDAVDQSGFGRDGTVSGAATATGKWSGALLFNGSSDYVSLPSNATNGLSRFSVSLWVKTTESRRGDRYWTHPTVAGMATDGNGSGDFAICLDNGKPGFFSGLIPGNDNSYYSSTAVNDGVWHHLAAVNDGVTVRLYIDGALDGGGYLVSGLPLNGTGFYLGKSNRDEPVPFAGAVDELRIYDRPLAADEVALLAGTPPAASVPLTVTRTGSGGGSVTLAPSELVCGSASCGALFPPGSAVTLKPAPDAASLFAGWSGACSGTGDCSLTLSAPAAAGTSFRAWREGVVAYYPFAGSADDVGPSGNNGTASGATAASDRFATAGGAYAFDGTQGSIALAGPSWVGGSRTFSIWVKPGANSGAGLPVLAAGGAGSEEIVGVGATSGACNFGAGRVYLQRAGAPCLDTGVDLAAGGWSQIAVTYDAAGGTLTFYKNGVKATSVAGTLRDYPISAVTVGANGTGGTSTKGSFNGSLDDLAIYDRALNEAELLSLYRRQGVASAVASPGDGSSLAGGVFTVTGSAASVADRQVGLVEVSTDGGITWLGATDTSGNGSWGSWSYAWRPSAISTYPVQARARDAAGNYQLLVPALKVQVTFLYTPTTKASFATGADFALGLNDGVGMGTGGLQLTSTQQALPFLWVPNNNDTVSKIDTASGRELGRYRITPPGVYGNDSRTTVDLAGNVWLGNRNAGSVVKIGLLENGQCVDRNGNGSIDTSRDGNGNGAIDEGELLAWAADECVLAEVILIPGREGNFVPGTYAGGYVNDYWNPGPRSFAVDAANNVWVGTYGTRKFYYLDGASGKILKTVDISSTGHTPYGAVMDSAGRVWSSGNASNVLRLDPSTDPPTATRFDLDSNVYGITADHQGHIFTSGYTDSRLGRVDAATGNQEWAVNMPGCGRGAAVDSANDVWIASSCANAVFRYSASGTLLAQIAVPTSATGVAVDSLNRVWAVGNAESVYRINPATNAVDLEGRLPGSGGHYAYSDMTGVIVRTITTRIGTWSALYDGGSANRPWGKVTWSATVPSGASFQIKVRSSNDMVNWSDWERATSGAVLKATPDGRYLMVMATFTGSASGATPVLSSLSIAAATTPLSQRDTTPPSGSVEIDGGQVVTDKTAVILTLAATDNSGAVSRMRLSADGSAWGDWLAYETSRGWTLATGDGPKKVHVQFRDVAGNVSPTFQATIELHTTIPTSTATPPGGCFGAPQTVTLAADEPGTIYYTTDGSDPSTSPSALSYQGPFTVSAPARLRYYAKDVWGYAEGLRSAEFSFLTGAAPEGITPASAGIPAQGLRLWLRGDAGTCVYLNDRISGWRDLSGNGNVLAGTGAVVVPDGLNGKPAVRFDGSGIYSQQANPVGAPYTVLTVSRQDGNSRQRLISSASTNWLAGYHGGREDQLYTEGWVNQPAIPATGAPYLYTATGSGGASALYRNSTKLVENANGTAAPGLLALGGTPIYGEASDGEVAEVLVYDSVLSDEQRAQVEGYLKTRYQLAYPLTVRIQGAGSGRVSSSGVTPAVSCTTGSCTGTYPAGTRVTLTAAPVAGSAFGGWQGPCSGTGSCTVPVDQAKTVTALFDPPPHPESGMVLYYPLDGTAGDLSGFGRDGTLSGTAPAADKWGGDGKAVSLDGSGDHIQVPSFPMGGAFTVSAWLYASDPGPSWQRLIDFGNGAGIDNVFISLTYGELQLHVHRGGYDQWVGSTEKFPKQQWVRVTVTHDGVGTARIYFDGALRGEGAVHPAPVMSRSAQYVGRSNWSWDPPLAGTLDDFRIYGRELSLAEINALASAPPAANLLPLNLKLEGAPGYNKVRVDPGAIVCAAEACGTLFGTGTTVTLTAQPHATASFKGWSGACAGSQATCSVAMSEAKSVTATFEASRTALVASYPFTGNADDASGNGLDGTLDGATPTANRFGTANRAYSFDGVDDRILVADPIPDKLRIQKEITLEAWIYVAEYPGELGMIVGSQYDGSGSGASIMLDGRANPDGQTAPAGHIHFQIGDGSWHVTNSGSPVPLNQWVHVVATRRADEPGRIYYDGVLQPSTSALWPGGVTYNSSWFAMGRQKDLNRPFKGKIDDVRIYARALTGAEVAAHYAEPASDYTVTVEIAGTNGGAGSVNSIPGGIACSSGTCASTFPNGSAVKLVATPDGSSLFTGWSGACSGGSDCSLTMDAAKGVVATFHLPPWLRIQRTPQVPYATVQQALNAALANDVIQMREGTLSGAVMAGRPGTFTLRGGYNPAYSSHAGMTRIQGKVTLRAGKVVADGVRVK